MCRTARTSKGTVWDGRGRSRDGWGPAGETDRLGRAGVETGRAGETDRLGRAGVETVGRWPGWPEDDTPQEWSGGCGFRAGGVPVLLVGGVVCGGEQLHLRRVCRGQQRMLSSWRGGGARAATVSRSYLVLVYIATPTISFTFRQHLRYSYQFYAHAEVRLIASRLTTNNSTLTEFSRLSRFSAVCFGSLLMHSSTTRSRSGRSPVPTHGGL